MGGNFSMTKQSKAKKGQKRLYEVSIAAWIDLLGYGSMLEKVNFDPTKPEAQNALRRLNDFHTFLLNASLRDFPIQAINDGAIIYRDLSPRGRSVTFAFFDRCIRLFQEINSIEKKQGYPGARMVIATGFRVRIKDQNLQAQQGYISNISNRIKQKLLSPLQAINEAFKSRPTFGMIPELQANFAFTKAYLVDTSGSRGGFAGPNCFIDLSMLDVSSGDWISFEKIVDWTDKGMSSQFGQLKTFDRDVANKTSHKGILDAYEIAEKISKQDNITNVLRQNIIKDNPLMYR